MQGWSAPLPSLSLSPPSERGIERDNSGGGGALHAQLPLAAAGSRCLPLVPSSAAFRQEYHIPLDDIKTISLVSFLATAARWLVAEQH